MMRRPPTHSPLRRLALLLAFVLLAIGLIVGLGKPAPAAEEELDDFVPTEQIRADSAVSFPVDI